jgi:MFS family permease
MNPDSPSAEPPPATRLAVGVRGLYAALRHHTFRSLKHRNYRLYFYGQIVSYTGSWMQNAALMWLVFERTSDPIWPPVLLVAQVGPTLLLGTWGGALADRWPKRRIVFATQSGFLATAATLTLLVALRQADPWVLLAVQSVNGLIQAADLPARLAFVPDLVPRQDLINAIGLNSLLFNSARAVGPALAGLLFVLADWVSSQPVAFGAMGCFALNTLSFAAVLSALRRITVSGERHAAAPPAGSTWDGLRSILARPRLAGLMLLTGLLCIFGWPALSLFPAYTKLALGHAEKEYSVLVSTLGAGALVGALTTATFGSVGRRGLFLTVGAALAAVGLSGLVLAADVGAAGAAAGCLGAGLILFLSTGQSAVQLSVADELRGRVMALWAMTLSASAPVGHLLAGAAATVWPIRDVLTVMALGVALVAAGMAVLALRGWKRDAG